LLAVSQRRRIRGRIAYVLLFSLTAPLLQNLPLLRRQNSVLVSVIGIPAISGQYRVEIPLTNIGLQ
jgi:hypothetical protein